MQPDPEESFARVSLRRPLDWNLPEGTALFVLLALLSWVAGSDKIIFAIKYPSAYPAMSRFGGQEDLPALASETPCWKAVGVVQPPLPLD